MFFSELYSAYYSTVAAVLREAVKQPVTNASLREIVERNAFGESIVSIPAALEEERWQLLKPDGTTPLQHKPTMPLTLMQKRWLKAVACDPRIRLFGDVDFESAYINANANTNAAGANAEVGVNAIGANVAEANAVGTNDWDEIEPLFLPEDVIVFDRYADGDDYENEEYIANFRLILDAIRKQYPLDIEVLNRKGEPVRWTTMPEYLEYSEKDDKFRLIGATGTLGSTINLGRLISCKPAKNKSKEMLTVRTPAKPRTVIFELIDERKALERVLLHFAHFEKSAEHLEDNKYKVTIHYDKDDETELVIRILSFGPMIRVTAPEHFVELIKERLIRQRCQGTRHP